MKLKFDNERDFDEIEYDGPYDKDGYQEDNIYEDDFAYIDDEGYPEDDFYPDEPMGPRGKGSLFAGGGRRKGESKPRAKKQRHQRAASKGRFGAPSIFSALSELSAGERIVISTGILVLILAVVTGSVYFSARKVNKQIDGFMELGKSLDELSVIGESGLIAVTDAHVAALSSMTPVETEEDFLEDEEPERVGKDRIIMNLTSVEKDLKIKFLNGATGKLFSDIAFRVSVEDPSGKTSTWEDDNKDGIIYKTKLSAGDYKVTIEEMEELAEIEHSIETIKVVVKAKIEYKKVDVTDEIKTESQVNVAKEDTAIQESEKAPANKDTVEWVESSKGSEDAPSESQDDYKQIDKSSIPDPNTEAGGRRTFETMSLMGIDDEEDDWEADDTQVDDSTNNNQNNINVPNPDVTNIEKVTIQGPTSVKVGETAEYTVKVEGTNLTDKDKEVAWFITKDLAVVDEKGKVTAQKPGLANLSVILKNHTSFKTQTFLVEIKGDGSEPEQKPSEEEYTGLQDFTSIKFDTSVLNLEVGEVKTVTASANVGLNPVYMYRVDNQDIVSISPKNLTVTVKGEKDGEANITLTITEGAFKRTESFKVIVGKNAANDKATKLKDKNGHQVYIKKDGKFVEATLADYYTAEAFYVKEGSESTTGNKYTGWQVIEGKTYYYNKNGEKVTGSQVIQGAKYEFDKDGVLIQNSKTGVMGIDVSKWNGTINWSAVKNSGVKYAIIRCGYRGSSSGALIQDPKFRENLKGAANAGIKVGVYFFTQALNEVEAVEEASMVISLLSGAGISYPVFLDVEASGGRGDKIDAQTRTAAVNAFCKTIQNAGYKAGVYANKTWFETKLNTSSLTGYKLWLAQYTTAPTYTAAKIDMWQYTSKGTVGGVSGNVDMNLSYMGE